MDSYHETKELNIKLGQIETKLKGFLEKHSGSVDSLQRQFDAFTLECLRPRGDGSFGRKTIGDLTDLLSKHADFEVLRKSGRGRAVIDVPSLLNLETKATITSAGIVPYVAETGIAPGGRKRYLLRQFFRSTPIETGAAHFIRETAVTDAASPQVEAEAKSESAFEFEGDTAEVKTIATFTPATRQVLDDLNELGEHIENSLLQFLEREIEEQLIAGDGTGQNLEGLSVNATAFDSTILSASDGYEYPDVLGSAALQLSEMGYTCDMFIVSPRTWFRILSQKNTAGDYIFGSPASERMREILWNCQIVPSHAIGTNSFLAGSSRAAHIRMRQESTIDISDSHEDYFTKNKIAIRGEVRLAFVKRQPGAWISGTLTQSPA